MSYKKSPFENAPKKFKNQTRFNLSHEHKAQMQPGYLVPCMRPIETLPMDEFEIDTEFFFRFANLYFPIMHRITMRADYYYLPLRIMWEKGEGATGFKDWLSKNAEIEPPKMNARMTFNTLAFNVNVLAFFGVPLLFEDATWDTHINDLNAFPLSAYLMTWDWYERIPQLEDERWFPLKDGDNTSDFETAFGVAAGFVFPLLSARWEKDMFTSALPSPQVGEAIKIPITDPLDPRVGWVDSVLGTPVTGDLFGATDPVTGEGKTQIGATDVILDVTGTIKLLREAEVLQTFYERIMKIGDNYDDFIEGLWGGEPQPGIINIPQLIGSKFGKVQISDVMITADVTFTQSGSKAGNYRGQANLYGSSGGIIRYKCAEHGFIICIVQINANTSYGQGIDRLWRRSVQTDYALDIFASIGDQQILKEEVFYNAKTGEGAKNQQTFGYIDRFAEYKWMNNLHVANLNFTAGLSQHLGRVWDPELIHGAVYDENIQINAEFTMSAPVAAEIDSENYGGQRLVDVFRTIPSGNVTGTQYPTEGIIYTWFFHSIFVNRSLPLYSTPKL